MNRRVAQSLALAALALASPSAIALDLTPSPGSRELEGFQVPILLFADGKKKVVYQPPANWHISGGGASLSFHPLDPADTVMQFRVRPRHAADASAGEDVEKWCRALLPSDASAVEFNGEAAGRFMLGPLSSHEYTFSYGAQGCRFTKSIAVVELPAGERFALIVTARAADFKAAHETAVRSMFSWSWRD